MLRILSLAILSFCLGPQLLAQAEAGKKEVPSKKVDAKPAGDEPAPKAEKSPSAEEIAKKSPQDLAIPDADAKNSLVTEKGSRIQGKFEGVEGGRLVFTDPDFGRVKVKAGNVHSILMKDSYRIWYQEKKESDVLEGRLAPLFYGDDSEDIRFRVHRFTEDGEDEFLSLDPASLHKVSLRSYTLKPSIWKFTGNISTSFEWHDGNTNRQNIGLNMRFRYQHPNHIFNMRSSYSSAETNGKRSAQRANGEFSYRYLFTTHNAVFSRVVVAHDDFAKLAIRTITSLGLTFYFYKEKDITWSLDAGASYTEEHRKRGALNKYSDGGQVSTRLDTRPDPDIRIIFSSRATIPFDAPKEALITSEVNVSFNVWKDLTFGILVRNDHDSEPPPNVEHNNYRVRFLLGWSFR